MPDFKSETLNGMSSVDPLEEGITLPAGEMLDGEEPQMSPEELKFAARVVIYGSEELATEVTQFYKSLSLSHRARFGNIPDIEERNRLASELAEKDAERMDRSRGRGYIQHPGHTAWRNK